MKKVIICFILCSQTLSVLGQVVNIESLRKLNDSSKFSGSARIDFNFSKDVNTVYDITNQVRFLYNFGKNSFFLINNLSFRELNGERFNNKNLQHLRYNYHFSKKVALDAFVQLQKDVILFINNRTLVGLGTRFNLLSSSTNDFYLGTLLMYENENSKGIPDNFYEESLRGDFYFSFNLRPNKFMAITSTAYYQPKLKDLKDYRISFEASISFNIVKNLYFVTSFTYQDDSFPVFTIPEVQYRIENGLAYTF